MDRMLYFFTSSFPFNSGETFIETEINYLSKEFNNIIIQPLYAYDKKNIRKIPDNCTLLPPIIKNRWQHYLVGLFGFKSVPIYFNDFFKKRVYRRKQWIKRFYIDFCTTNNILQSQQLNKIIKNIKENDLMYFYWGKGAANLLPFIKKNKAKKVVRFHGGDLYTINYGGYIPIHSHIINNADILVFISQHGLNYLKSRYQTIEERSIISYLGTKNFGVSTKSNDGVFRILSCSNVIPLKRVHLILDALQLIKGLNVEWTHIGDGSEFENIKNKSKQSNKNIKINLLGRLQNKEVIQYYLNHPVDAFINVSSTEGLPVSIMEAISFNVPVIATNVGGTSEIVNDLSGILLVKNPDITEIAESILKLKTISFNPRQLWHENFNADKNYSQFIKSILQD